MPSTAPPLILIADDIAANRDTLRELLEPQAYRLVEAGDGPTALRLAAESPPDLVLLDIMMPGMDGLEVCRRLRADARLAEVPVIMVTSLDDQASRLAGLEAGADDFVTKPFNRAELRARVRTITRLNRYRRLAETRAALSESEERFRQFAEQSSEGFWFYLLKPERVFYVSPAVERIWGLPADRLYEDAHLWMASIHSEDRARVAEVWATCLQGRSSRFEAEFRVLRPDGSVRWVADSGTPIRNAAGEISHVAGISRDITERRETEKQMLRSQRLESLGSLAGGVAHDLNNALAPITLSVEMLRLQYPGKPQLLDMIAGGTQRAADMVRQLLTFAKGAEGERVSLQPAHLLNEMQGIMKGTFPKNIQLEVRYEKELPTLRGDGTQLHQVLLNLCVNARDAMPHGGKLTLEAQSQQVDAALASSAPDAQPGPYVLLRVRDTGTGIPAEILDRIFDPFFTTKSSDKGTGLGLSTALGIVKGHNGFLQVHSQPGQGTTFAVYLPADATAGATEHRAEPAGKFRGQGETILFVDDEAAMREAGRAVLRRLNFEPLTAEGGADGLKQAVQHRSGLCAIITDLHMPQMSGLDFVRALRRMVPAIPIVVSSGRIDEMEEEEFKTLGVTQHLAKPFSEAQLADVLRTIVARK